MARSPFGRSSPVDPFSDEARFPTLVKPAPVGLQPPAQPPVFGSVEARNDPTRFGSIESRNDPNQYGSVLSRNDPSNYGPRDNPGVSMAPRALTPTELTQQKTTGLQADRLAAKQLGLFASPAMQRLFGSRGLVSPALGADDEYGDLTNGF